MIGLRAFVFDASEWSKVGDCTECPGNECFFREATIVGVGSSRGRPTINVQFDHRSRVSRGHFTRGARIATHLRIDR